MNGQMTLENVTSAKRTRPPRILLIGTEKIGKSTFASEADEPVFVPMVGEEGIDGVDVQSFPVAQSFVDVRQALMQLGSNEHDFKTVVLDSVSALHPMVIKQAIAEEGVDSEAKLGGGYGRQYDTPLLKWADLMKGLDFLRSKGMASILIGHVTTTSFKDPIHGEYTRYDLDLPTKIREQIYRWVDVILFADWSVYRKTEDTGFNQTQKMGVGDGSRKLHTQKRPSHPGGGRGVYGQLPYELPLNWAEFTKAVSAQLSSKKESPEDGQS